MTGGHSQKPANHRLRVRTEGVSQHKMGENIFKFFSIKIYLFGCGGSSLLDVGFG